MSDRHNSISQKPVPSPEASLPLGEVAPVPLKPVAVWHSRPVRYASAVVSVILATLCRLALLPLIGRYNTPYLTYFAAVVFSAWIGGAGPGILSVLLGALTAVYLFIPPLYSLHLLSFQDSWGLGVFVFVGLGVTALGEAQRRARHSAGVALHQTALKADQLTTTMRSIGEGVIVTDAQGRITLVNEVAARLTGWSEQEANGREAHTVFAIKREQTGDTIDSPVQQVLANARPKELLNHTMLVAKSGSMAPIDYSVAPILTAGKIGGAVVVFRDVTARHEEERQLRESEEQQRLAMEAGQVATWDWDIVQDKITWSDRLFTFYGLEKTVFTDSPRDLVRMIHPDDQARIREAVAKAHTERAPYKVEFRVVRPDGEIRWLSTSGMVLFDSAGKPYRMLGATTDTTLARREERIQSFLLRLDEIVRPLSDPTAVTWETVCALGKYLNASRCTFVEIDVAQDRAIVHSDFCQGVASHAGTYAASTFGSEIIGDLKAGLTVVVDSTETDPRTSAVFDSAYNRVEVRSMITVPLVKDGLLSGVIGVHSAAPRKWTVEEIELVERVMKRMWLIVENARLFRIAQEELAERKQTQIEQQFLTDASEILASSLDYEETLQRVAKLAVPHIGDWCAVDMLEENERIVMLGVGHIDPEKIKWAHELRRLYPPHMGEPGLPNVLRTGKPEIYSDITDEMLVMGARDAQHLEIMREIGFRSAMIVPILSRDRVLGAITFVTTGSSGHLYTEKDQALAEGLAARAALAIDNARLYRTAQQELEERRRIQDALRLSEERFRFALANSGITVYMTDSDLRYTWSYNGSTGGEIMDIRGKHDRDFLEPEDAAQLSMIKQRVMEIGIEERQVVRATRLGQKPRFYDTLFAPLRSPSGVIIGITGTVHDVTERKEAQDALVGHQAEIEMLNVRLQRSMRETHHRVKNNLQVITALVNMQEMQYEEKVPVSELARLTQHIRSLASIHDLLTHQAETDAEVSDISVRQVMEKLMPTVQGMVAGRDIAFEVEDIRLPVRQSSTFAVLVNELISNALKHGAGEIRVEFRIEGSIARLAVLDEGRGFPADFNPDTAANTGLDLIGSLARMDMRGRVLYENRPTGGGRVVVEFPIPALTKTPGEE